ncbi:MAG TPA: phosphatase PAP2 family protein [Bryobacteraceae bacterium]|jgi:DNA-binding beta-propeller fold protein YncE
MKNLVTILFFAALTPAVFAQSAPKKLRFLMQADINPARLLPPPPADGSEVQKQELADLKRLLKTRTPERFAQAKWDDAHEDASAFATVLGPEFDLKKLPATSKLLADVENDQSVAASTAKEYFHRVFAAVLDPSLTDLNCDPEGVRSAGSRPGGRGRRSYPSGHATMGYSVGLVLAALLPENAQAIEARAADYALSREFCAEHYHSDVEASHALGVVVGSALLNNAALQPEIAAAKTELKAAHLTKGASTVPTGYRVTGNYPVGGTQTWDYASIDSSARRLYISHQTQVEVLNADSGKAIGTIADTPGVHGIALATGMNRGFTSNGSENKVSIFDTRTLALISKIDVGTGPDGIYYEPRTKRVFTNNHGSHDISAIDAGSGRVVGTVKAEGDGEQAVIAADGMIYVNLEDKAEVIAFDPESLQVKKRFPIGVAKTPTGLAYDAKTNRLFIGTRSEPRMVAMDAATGKVLGSFPIGQGVDYAAFDPEARLIFFSCGGEGVVSVFREKSADEFEDAGTITTQASAKTMAFDPKTAKIFLPAAQVDMTPVTDVSSRPRRTVREGTFAVLVVGK